MTGHQAGSLAKSKLSIPNAAASLQRSSILRLFPPSSPWLAMPCFRRPACATGAACAAAESTFREREADTPNPTELKKLLRSINHLVSHSLRQKMCGSRDRHHAPGQAPSLTVGTLYLR